jgi:hypothetical protein
MITLGGGVFRVLNLNGAVRSASVRKPTEEWAELPCVSMRDGGIYAETSENLVDYDIFIVDQDKIPFVERYEGGNVTQQIVERVHGGGCLIAFGARERMRWLPLQFQPRGEPGSRVNVVPDSQLAEFFTRWCDQITYKTQFQPPDPNTWNPGVTAQNAYPVAGFAWLDHGYIALLPEFTNREQAVRDFIDRELARILPSLDAAPPVVASEGVPEWIARYSITKADLIGHEIAALDAEIKERMEVRDAKERERQGILRFRGLLWQGGHALQSLVIDALNLLGIPAINREPVDIVCPVPAGGELFIEVEGPTHGITMNKGQQLIQYITASPEPSQVRGAIIGNPFRLNEPENRPPAGSQQELFVRQLREFADKQGWALVTTTAIFECVRSHLDGDPEAGERVRHLLGLAR